jgi:predicted RNA binding protein YcfA (HicA-like mRNA interferase family)
METSIELLKSLEVIATQLGFSWVRQSENQILLKHSDGRRISIPTDHQIKIHVLRQVINQLGVGQKDLANQDFTLTNDPRTEILEQVIQEFKQTPQEYLPSLLQLLRLFRESVTLKQVSSDISEQNATSENLEASRLAQQHKALKELTRLWIEEGDEQEQTETWEYLRQALDEDRLSHRPLFP